MAVRSGCRSSCVAVIRINEIQWAGPPSGPVDDELTLISRHTASLIAPVTLNNCYRRQSHFTGSTHRCCDDIARAVIQARVYGLVAILETYSQLKFGRT